MIKNQYHKYISGLISIARQPYLRCHNGIFHLNVKQVYFKNTFFISILIEWNNLDSNVRNCGRLVLPFTKRSANSTFQ